MRFGTLCSGIGAPEVAFKPLGWEPVFMSEIEKFPKAVLAHRFPGVPDLGDMTAPDFVDRAEKCGPIDLLVAGCPCQSFSIAGLRGGLSDARGNLTLRFIEIVHGLKPRFILYENVPGILNSADNAFGCLLAGLSGADDELRPPVPGEGWPSAGVVSGTKYSLAWRVLNAEYFGVPQRRNRVFLVGYSGDWRTAAQILFEPEGLHGNPTPRREKREGTAAETGEGFGGGGETQRVAGTLGANHGNIKAEDAWGGKLIAFGSKDSGADAVEDLAPTLRAGTHDGSHANAGVPPAVCYDMRGYGDGKTVPTMTGDHLNRPTDYTPMVFESRFARNGRGAPEEVCPPLKAQSGESGKGDSAPLVVSSAVRRLTPRECERLQYFPDDFTLIPWRGGMAPDGPRYKALGNSMAVCCISWIGRRIKMVSETK